MLVHDFDLRTLHGADYNPRRIDEADLAELRESLRTLGIIKPIIVRGSTIVAGHQRQRSALAAGITHGPVFLLDAAANTYDEVRFNQLHNGTDLDDGASPVAVLRDLTGVHGWLTVSPDEIDGDFRSPGAVVRVEIQRLAARFGPWGACVVTPEGQVMHCRQYALALAAMRLPVTCYVLASEQVEAAERFLGRTYGVFNYDHLPRHTFIQTYAQPFRLRGETGNRSSTYDAWALPWLTENPGARMLDFGCGQGDHAKEAADAGHAVLGVELFRRVRGKDALDVGASKHMVLMLANELKKRGRFDAVLCDYVLNSVDCPLAETSLLACLDLFVRPGGKLFFSGRCMERVTNAMADTKSGIHERRIQFLDGQGFSALYRKGEWFYQRFHTQPEIDVICERHGWEITRRRFDGMSWAVEATKGEQRLTQASYEAAVRYEFTMPVNTQGRTLGVVDAMLAAAARVW
jgi:ParB family chromosome partitioning protein